MHPLNIQHESLRSDQPSITFETNGSQGGGPDHGGYATLVIEMLNPDMKVSVNRNSVVVNDASRISIMVAGDIEVNGLAVALMDIGAKLLMSFPK